jgi:hypothetical protein
MAGVRSLIHDATTLRVAPAVVGIMRPMRPRSQGWNFCDRMRARRSAIL